MTELFDPPIHPDLYEELQRFKEDVDGWDDLYRMLAALVEANNKLNIDIKVLKMRLDKYEGR